MLSQTEALFVEYSQRDMYLLSLAELFNSDKK